MDAPPPTRQLPSLAGADWLARRQTRAVFDALAAAGFAARAVGGAVRNALLDRPVVDIDIATPLGISVHDHIIVGKNGHASLKGLKLI